MSFTAAERAECAEREVKQREKVYPRLVNEKRMSPLFAALQIALMKDIAERLRAEADAEAAKTRLI